MNQDEKFMARAIQLAEKGIGLASPNPSVGCVIVYEGNVIGEGFTSPYGGPHAEVNAINSVKNQELLKNSTIYVSLEPCAHYGKTPPCADLIVSKKIPKAVIAMEDPFPKVDGKGIEKLKKAGVQVVLGTLESEANFQNRRFLTFHAKKRPYVILKWAETADGFIARTNGDSKWISGIHSRQLVHQWRSKEDAILVGKHTALNDNPSLTTREWVGKNPTRVLLDSNLEVSENSSLFDNSAKTIIYNRLKDLEEGSNHYIQVEALSPASILADLHKQKIQSIIIEGGAQVLNSFIEENCWNEARVFIADKSFDDGIKAPKIDKTPSKTESIDSDTLKIYYNDHGRRPNINRNRF